ncbi:MAG TPA: uroporphyrinogen decarboxylase family protein [Armatimonadota bacterium]|jgi:uroporphyrinogen decarboxylase
MTSKERVRDALEHRQPDRVPLDYYARAEVSAAVRARLGLGAGESVEEALGADLRGVGPRFGPPSHELGYADPTVEVTPDGLYRDIWGVGFRANQTEVGFYMDLADCPLRGLREVGELDDYPWPSADDWDYSGLPTQLDAAGEYWTWGASRGIFEISWFMRGFEEFMLDLALRPELAGALMDRVQAYLLERTRRLLAASGGRLDMVEYNDDTGGQNGLLLSPAMWRQFLRPRMVEFIGLCREHGARVRYHSCGGVRPIIPDLIEIGVDALNPVQTMAAGMEPAALKRDFGDRITWSGGVDTQGLLPNGSREEVAAHTRWLIETLGKDGGLILGPAHVFQPDVPVENVLAVYETALGRRL